MGLAGTALANNALYKTLAQELQKALLPQQKQARFKRLLKEPDLLVRAPV